MGIADRDYFRRPPPSRAVAPTLTTWSVTTWLIVANVFVFLLDLSPALPIAVVVTPAGHVDRYRLLDYFGQFTVAAAVHGVQLWRFVTFQFLHAGPQHLVFNMLALFFFGPIVEPVLGRGRYLAFYLLSGVAGGVLLYACYVVGLTFAADPRMTLVGASAGIFGVLVAAAVVAPDIDLLVFGIVPVPARVGAWAMIGIAAFTVLTGGFNAGGEAAHLGGAAAGYALITHPKLLDFAARRRPPMTVRR